MPSRTLSLCGSRIPSLLRRPAVEVDLALADDVVAWCDAIGLGLFDWQNDQLRNLLGVAPDGKWAAYEATIVVPRQNGKNEILIARELAEVALLGGRHVIHSAHEFSTAQKHFQRMQDLADQLPEFRKLLPGTKTLGFYTSNGKEHITFRNGGVIEFKARTKAGVRGFSAPLVVLDEAFELPPKAVGSMTYVLRAKPNPQIIKTSSPAHETSIVLHTDRRRARRDDPMDARFYYVEWANEPDADPGDPEVWARSNPSLGLRAPGFELDVQTFRNEYAAAKEHPELLAEFVREVVGVPTPLLGEGDGVEHPMPGWYDLVDPSAEIVSNRAWALSVSPVENGPQAAAFGLAGRTADGRLLVSIMGRDPAGLWHAKGTAWVVPAAVQIQAKLGLPLRVHADGPEGAFVKPLREAGVVVEEVSSGEVARSTGLLIAAANGDTGDDGGLPTPTLVHLGQPSLDRAVRGAVLRSSASGAVSWSQRKSSVEITPLQAVTVAAGGVPDVSEAYEFFAY